MVIYYNPKKNVTIKNWQHYTLFYKGGESYTSGTHSSLYTQGSNSSSTNMESKKMKMGPPEITAVLKTPKSDQDGLPESLSPPSNTTTPTAGATIATTSTS